MSNDEIKLLELFINDSHKITFFGGAGVSTESGGTKYKALRFSELYSVLFI